MLIGEYSHSIDEKNRLSLPAKFRQKMGKKVVVTAGLDGCLYVLSEKEWITFSEKLLSTSSDFKADNRSFNRYLLGSASDTEVDSIGRILIPETLKTHAGLSGKVAVVGVGARAEIWNEKRWIEYKQGVEKQADTLAEKLGQAGMY